MLFKRRKMTTQEYYPCSIEYVGELPPANVHTVYALYDSKLDEIFYVGLTNRFEDRMGDHCVVFEDSLRKNPLDQRKLQIHRNGQHTEVLVLYMSDDRAKAEYMETTLIAAYGTRLCNSKKVSTVNGKAHA